MPDLHNTNKSWQTWCAAQLLPRNKIKLVMARMRHNTSLDCHHYRYPSFQDGTMSHVRGDSQSGHKLPPKSLLSHLSFPALTSSRAKGGQWNRVMGNKHKEVSYKMGLAWRCLLGAKEFKTTRVSGQKTHLFCSGREQLWQTAPPDSSHSASEWSTQNR